MKGKVKVAQLLKADSLWPHGLYIIPWNSPGQNTGVGSPSLLQGIVPTQELIPGLPHCRRILTEYKSNRQDYLYLVLQTLANWGDKKAGKLESISLNLRQSNPERLPTLSSTPRFLTTSYHLTAPAGNSTEHQAGSIYSTAFKASHINSKNHMILKFIKNNN